MVDFLNILKSLQPYAVGISFIAIYIAEHLLPERKDLLDRKHDLYNISVGLLNLIIAGIGGYYLQKWLNYSQEKQFGLLNIFPLHPWLKTMTGFVLIDFYMYWWHRANHEIKFFWKFHRFHHRDTKLNSTSALRFHAVELGLSFCIRFILFPLLGVDVATVILYSLVLLPVFAYLYI